MGYANYDLQDGAGPRGYAVADVCHAEGCDEKIDRGLSYLCYGCGGYFCGEHRTVADAEFDSFAGRSSQCCKACAAEAEQVKNTP